MKKKRWQPPYRTLLRRFGRHLGQEVASNLDLAAILQKVTPRKFVKNCRSNKQLRDLYKANILTLVNETGQKVEKGHSKFIKAGFFRGFREKVTSLLRPK